MKYSVTVLEIVDLDSTKYTNTTPKSSVKATLKANNKLASSKIVYIRMETSDSNNLSVGESIQLDKDDFTLSTKDTNNGNVCNILTIV